MPMLQIHDELCFSIYGNDDIIKIKKEMENSIENLRVPFKVDVAKEQVGEKHMIMTNKDAEEFYKQIETIKKEHKKIHTSG